MSSTFPAAAAAAILLNHAPHPELISIVKGAGDSTVITSILDDLKNNSLKSEYIGHKLIEDGVWGDFHNLEPLEPFIKNSPLKDFRINPVAPFTGCIFSCKFCSISTMPQKYKSVQFRDPDDFVSELRYYQKGSVDFKNRYYFFTPDNLFSNKKGLISF
jgi:hypothetical protein